jgi:hypothetical protein
LRRRLPLRHSRASIHAGCRVASTNAAASDLPASPPLIQPSPLVAPWPPVTLVRLVVASPLLPPPPPICRRLHLSSRNRLSLRHGLPYLLSGWLSRRLRRSSSRCAPPAGCRVASAAHPLGAPLPLNAPLPLDAQHPHPTSRSPFADASDLPASPPLILPSPLVVPWPHVPLDRLVVALSLLTLPPPICQRLRLSSRRRLSSRHGLQPLVRLVVASPPRLILSARSSSAGCQTRSSSSCEQVI